MNDNSYKVIDVDINEILPNRFQPRIQFDEEEILELSDSIKEHGVIQPLVVRTIGDKYEIIAGERRYKASVLAGKETVPVIIKNLNDKDSAEIALIENIQRKNLTPIEEAISYKKILDMGYLTQETLATKLGKSQSSVANKIRLLNLSDEVQEALLENKISERHARSLLRLKSLTEQNKMLDNILKNRLTVRKTDTEIDKILNGKINELNEIKEEKGELNMNNETNQFTASPSTFDIFGTIQPTPSTMEAPSVQAIEPVEQPEVSSTPMMPTFGGIEFDANEAVIAAPSVPTMEVPSVPAIEPITPVAETPVMPIFGGMDFNANETVIAAPSVPTMEVPSAPTIESITPVAETPVMPIFGGMDFNANEAVIATPSVPTMEVPSVPAIEPIIDIPSTSPIIDATSDKNEGSLNVEVNSLSMNNVIPEPIIVTDYSKQYDPIMPEQQINTLEKVDFKDVINAIRECSQKIEKYGYKIDVEEYDLSTLYQVVFKIEK